MSNVNIFKDWISIISNNDSAAKNIPIANIELFVIDASPEVFTYLAKNRDNMLGFKSISIFKKEKSPLAQYEEFGSENSLNVPQFYEQKIPTAFYVDTKIIDAKSGPRNYNQFVKNIYFVERAVSILLANLKHDFPLVNYWTFKKIFNNESPDNYVVQLTDWAYLHQLLPSPSPKMEQGSEEWVAGLKIYYRVLLTQCGLQSNYIDKFFTDENIAKLIISLTAPSKSISRNYEAYEFYGDTNLTASFEYYMSRKFENPTPRQLTEFSNQFMSKNYQQFFSDDLRLIDWVLVGKIGIPSENVSQLMKFKTDIMESLIGVIGIIGDSISSALGVIIVRSLVTILGNSLYFDDNMVFGLSRTYIEQVLERMGLEKTDLIVEYAADRNKDEKTIGIDLSSSAKILLRDLGFRNDELDNLKYLFKVKDSQVDEVDFRRMAFDNYRDRLRNIGVDEAFLDKNFNKDEFNGVSTVGQLLRKTGKTIESFGFITSNGFTTLYLKDGGDNGDDILAVVPYAKSSDNRSGKSNMIYTKENAIDSYLKSSSRR